MGADHRAERLDELDDAFGRTLCAMSVRTSIHSGAFACAIAVRRPSRSSLSAAKSFANSSSAFWRPRTRPTGTITPSSTVRIGLTFRREPASAWALPIRPPFWRYSSVATVKTTRFVRLKRSTSSSISSSVVPASSRRSIASASNATASEAVSVSTSRTRSPSSCSAARRADSYVPESFDVRWSDQIRSYPAAASSS